MAIFDNEKRSCIAIYNQIMFEKIIQGELFPLKKHSKADPERVVWGPNPQSVT